MSTSIDVFNRRIEQIEYRLQRIERFGNVLTSTQTLTTFGATGNAATKLGLQSDGKYALAVFNSSQHEIIRVGQSTDATTLTTMDVFDNSNHRRMRIGQLTSTGRYGAEVYDNSGNTKARLGTLGDGTFGVEISTGGSGLVHLQQLAFAQGYVSNVSGVNTSSTVLVDLSPATSVTASVGNSGRAIVLGGAFATCKANNQTCIVSLTVDSRASTTIGAVQNLSGGASIGASAFGTALVTGLSSGSHTFKLQFRQTLTGSSASFADRQILVLPF